VVFPQIGVLVAPSPLAPRGAAIAGAGRRRRMKALPSVPDRGNRWIAPPVLIASEKTARAVALRSMRHRSRFYCLPRFRDKGAVKCASSCRPLGAMLPHNRQRLARLLPRPVSTREAAAALSFQQRHKIATGPAGGLHAALVLPCGPRATSSPKLPRRFPAPIIFCRADAPGPARNSRFAVAHERSGGLQLYLG